MLCDLEVTKMTDSDWQMEASSLTFIMEDTELPPPFLLPSHLFLFFLFFFYVHLNICMEI